MDQPSNLEKSIKVKRLIDEVISGEVGRSRFDIWEMDLLLDMLASDLQTVRYATRLKVLRQYQESACRRLEEGVELPLRMSQYLKSLRLLTSQLKPPPCERPRRVHAKVAPYPRLSRTRLRRSDLKGIWRKAKDLLSFRTGPRLLDSYDVSDGTSEFVSSGLIFWAMAAAHSVESGSCETSMNF
jgi:hypothetical protein